MAKFTELIKQVAAIFSIARAGKDEVEIRRGIEECTKGIKLIHNSMRYAKSIGEKQHHETSLRNLKTMRSLLKVELKRGAGISKHIDTTRVEWDDVHSIFNSRIRTGVISNLKHKDPRAFLNDCQDHFQNKIKTALAKDNMVKVNVIFCGEFEVVKGDSVQVEHKYFTTSNSPIYHDTNLVKWFAEKVIAPITRELEDFQIRDSGWRLRNVINLGVNINKFTPQLGSSYIELPQHIKNKKACVNVQNNDNYCFAWAVTSALYPPDANKALYRTSSYPHYSTVLKLDGIQWPLTIKQIPKFESQNDISINVYILEKQKQDFKTLPTYLTKGKKDRHVNLLMIQDTYNKAPTKYHFVWIKNISRLLSTQLSNHNGLKFFCDRCLHYFISEDKLNKHVEDCLKVNTTAIKMPKQDKNILKFINHKNKLIIPFVVYADLESILKPTNDPKKPQHHVPAAVGYFLKCSYDDSLSFYKSYRGQDCIAWFADQINSLAEDLVTVFWCPFDIDITPQQEDEFRRATHCHICEQRFTPEDKKVRDHNHLFPENNYRGAAHEDCNFNFKDSYTVPVVFHNLTGYDAHFIVTDIATKIDGKIDLLPLTDEKYISFTKHINDYHIKFRFIDSFRFMASSLDKLASYLPEFPNLKSQFHELSDEKFKLLTKKGVMPYDYLDSIDRFNEPSLPNQDAFYNKLENKSCPRRLYQRAREVWNTFDCQNLGEYIDLYMKTDILLLADVFERFRASCLKTYGLDSAHYFTLPSFTWDAMLKHTRVELKLLTDLDMFLFVERGIRGGLSQVCSKRRAKANNSYLNNYDPSKPKSYLMYYDLNNQYGWSMSQCLPYGGFKWVDTNIDVTTVTDDADIGYLLEVDLEYSQELHDQHKDIPFCSEHINPTTMKPPKTPNEQTKLMATLHNKTKYVIHYRALKQAIAHGLVLTKIHRVLKFKQSPWLKSYIDLNTHLRTKASNEFEKNLFKLINNAIYGKSLENVRDRVCIHLKTKWEGRYGAEAYISKPHFKKNTIFSEKPDLVAIEMNKLEVFLNKPIYIGQAILDLAKTTIYDFHYDYMIDTFPGCSVLYTDTDSLIYELNQDPYEVMKRDCHQRFDTSDYPPDNIYGLPQVNKKVLGMMKDENNGVPMTDYVGLRSKLYTTKVQVTEADINKKRQSMYDEGYDEDEINDTISNINVTKKAKGVKKSVVSKEIIFEDFVECLDKWQQKTIQQKLIRSKKHIVHSVIEEKIALSPEDDKRYLIPDTVETLPWGHYIIESPHLPSTSAMDVDDIL